MALTRIGTTPAALPRAGATGAAAEAAPGFESSLKRLVDGAEQAGSEANTAVAEMLSGTGEVHDAMIALQRAELALQLTVQVRNKLIQAYQDVMRMPV
ncbi:MAG: flagellar hook-basal body complex protein FliE [Acidobacteriota bacterium]